VDNTTVFDSGELRTDLSTSERVLNSLMANLTGSPFIGYKLPIVEAHDDVYKRFKKGSSYGTQRRFVRAMQHYALGVAHHVGHFTTNHIPSLEEMLSTRQLSVGVAPLYHLIEYAHEIVLPDEVFEHPVIQALERLGADLVILYAASIVLPCHSVKLILCVPDLMTYYRTAKKR
jgi:hypothetical protein